VWNSIIYAFIKSTISRIDVGLELANHTNILPSSNRCHKVPQGVTSDLCVACIIIFNVLD